MQRSARVNGRVLVAIGVAGLGAAIAVACGGTSVTQLTAPDPVRCDIALAAEAASVPASGTQLNLDLATPRDCTWSAQSNASWVQVSPTAGQGDAALTVDVAANTGQSSRAGGVTIGSAVYRITQAGAAAPPPHCAYILVPSSRSVNDGGGTREVRLLTPSDCPWTASAAVSWISLDGRTSGTGSTILRYDVDRNRSDDSRTGTIVIGGATHTVRQSGD
jgi:hypothetical protein